MSLVYCVEDDENIRELVRYALCSQKFQAEAFPDGPSFWKAMEGKKPDLVLLDIMLPGESGLDILKKLRSQPATAGLPIIMLTARTSEYDVVTGLDAGADDYISKPFGIMELLSRVKAVLRRGGLQKPQNQDLLVCGDITMDLKKHQVTTSGKPCVLTVKEFDLLHYLMANMGIVLSRDQIMEAVWDFSYAGESRTIDMHIRSLRQKLGPAGKVIQTVRGVGYRIQ
ncbi:MAG: response regulator transcription factor [Acidaminococcus sp.]|uniref:response regulator transcription factor n=1 Tax=Acidaminococcus sp. TaxID=1872103 RepID=UPI0026DEB741|nr:response regulator transcription factor [Acidaminococcus sp.]MDO5596744.1 response regulator transcription factor [Acidaminococcus sp.]